MVAVLLVLLKVLSHTLEAALVSDVNLIHLTLVVNLLERIHELLGVQFVIGAASLQNLRLLFHREVLPREVRVDVLLVESQDFIMGNGTRVGEVEDTGDLSVREGREAGRSSVKIVIELGMSTTFS